MKQPFHAFVLLLLILPGLAHALSGTVTDENGEPIAKAEIEIVGREITILSDNDGNFSFDERAVDEIHLQASGFAHKVLHLHGEYGDKLNIVLQRTTLEQVDVYGLPLHASTMESAQPISVVSGEQLRNQQASTLGETLKNQIGVHSSYFGPVSSSPIIRGLDGPRVLITQNALDLGDVSRVGPDHIVSTEASTAEQIEILRGPSTLIYGSGAIGGVVNVVDDRVPRDSDAKTAFSTHYKSVSSESEVSFAHTNGNDKLAFHIDGFWRDGDDYEIPGNAVVETEAEHEASGHEEHQEGVLENSASESSGYTIGGSLLLANGYVGLSYGKLDRLNGVPGHGLTHDSEQEPPLEEDHSEENVLSDLNQDRWQLLSEIALNNAILSRINTRLGYTEYQHAEVHAEDGSTVREVGTEFNNQTTQLRLDLLLNEFAGWRGAVSLEGKNSEFDARGEEAFTPASSTDQYALAFMQEKHTGNILWQLGARVEKLRLEAEPIDPAQHGEQENGETTDPLFNSDYSFAPLSVSAGLVWDFAERYNAAISLTHAERAPSAAELFANGPHIGTGSYEVGALFEIHQEGDEWHLAYRGDPEKEVSNNIDISLRKHAGDFGFVFNVFYNQISNYYYQHYTGLTSEDLFSHATEDPEHQADAAAHEHSDALPVYLFTQADTSFFGLESELAWQITSKLRWRLWGDSIRGKRDSGEYLPRIPPVRLGNQLEFRTDAWYARLELTRVFDQDKTANYEHETNGYIMVDGLLSYQFGVDDRYAIFLKGDNLFDEEARVHTSFLKDVAPLPGRNLSVGLRGEW